VLYCSEIETLLSIADTNTCLTMLVCYCYGSVPIDFVVVAIQILGAATK